MPCCLERVPALARLLKGEGVGWCALGMADQEFLKLCEAEDLGPLVYLRLAASTDQDEWPEHIRAWLSRRARTGAATELLLAAEVRAALADLANAGILPILIKGTPLAYSVYDAPACRPRNDTDLLLREEEVEAARAVFAARGYGSTIHCDDLFSQFEVQKADAFGVTHVFDVHWKISTQPVFENLVSYEELAAQAEAVPGLGAHARAAGRVHALLLACVHPVMHHQNVERALWTYDIHLLASGLSRTDFGRFLDMAREKKMVALCAHGLRRAQQMFHTAIPDAVLDGLLAGREPEASAAYLAEGRRWHDELVSIVAHLPGWPERLRHLREVLFPRPEYMLGVYGLNQHPLGALLLPVLYVHRNVHGAWKILSGRK